MCFINVFSDNGYICVTDNRTNPVFCIKHSTAEFRRELSKGQKKYALNVQWRAVKEGKSKYDKEVVTLLDGIDHTSDYRTLKRITGKNFA